MDKILFVLILCGCDYSPYDNDHYSNITNYNINITVYTDKGIGVDASNQTIDLVDIDRRTDEVEKCLADMFPDGNISNDTVQNSSCLNNHFDTIIHRNHIQVKIPPDWYRGCYDEHWQYVGLTNGEQLFPCNADVKLCMKKGFTPTHECPCACRAIIQDNKIIVTAPNMHLYKSELIRLVTGCNNIWTSTLAKCWSAE